MGIYMNMNFLNLIKEFFASAFKYVQTNLEKIVEAVTNLFTDNKQPDPTPPDERPTVPDPVTPDPPKPTLLELIAIWNVY
jgi:hypothetical protein